MGRVTVSIDDELQKQLDDYARANGYNRTEAIELAIRKLFEEDKQPPAPSPAPAPSPPQTLPVPKPSPQPVITRPGTGAGQYEQRIAELEHESQQNQFYLGDLFLVLETLSNQVQANCAMMTGGHYTYNPLLEIPAPPWLTGVDLVAPPPRPKKKKRKKQRQNPWFGMAYISESAEDVVTIYHWEDDTEAGQLISELASRGLEYRSVILDAEAPNARPCVQYRMKTYWTFEKLLKELSSDD